MRKRRRRRARNRNIGIVILFFVLCILMVVAIFGVRHEINSGSTEENNTTAEHQVTQEESQAYDESTKQEEASNMAKGDSIPFQRVKISEEKLQQKYYYNLLDDSMKTVYKQLLEGIMENVEEIYVYGDDPKMTNRLLSNVLNDFPEIFWCAGDISTTGYTGENPYSVAKVTYTYSGEEKERRRAQIEEAAKQCLAGVAENATTYETIKYVYEYIINTTDYVADAVDNQNIYSVFVGRQSVCAGYARATQYLLEKIGIFCTYVQGEAITPDTQSYGPHAWNLVKIDEEYYYVDTTWGDPVFSGDSSEDVPQAMESINYDYLCIDEKDLFMTHKVMEGSQLPSCTSTIYDYYRMNHSYFEDFDAQAVLELMKQSIDEKSNPVRMKLASQEAYDAALESLEAELFEEAAQYLLRSYNQQTVRYYYQNSERMRTITIYWGYET